jgi:sugar phosphate isomerase/epimerase
MKLGFSTYFFMGKSPLQVIEEGLSHGIRVFEISMEIPHVLGLNEEVLKEMENLGRQGVEFSMHAPFFEINVGSFFEDIRSISRRKVMKALDVAGRIGASPVVVHPGYTFLVGKAKAIEDRTKANFLEDLGELASHAEKRGVRIALENVHMPYFLFYDLKDFPAIHDRVPDMGIALDVGHAYIAKCAHGVPDREDSILSDISEIGIEHLRHVHLHGNGGAKDDHALLDHDVDLAKIVGGLERLGYAGKVVVESYDMEKYGMDMVMERLIKLRTGVSEPHRFDRS